MAVTIPASERDQTAVTLSVLDAVRAKVRVLASLRAQLHLYEPTAYLAHETNASDAKVGAHASRS